MYLPMPWLAEPPWNEQTQSVGQLWDLGKMQMPSLPTEVKIWLLVITQEDVADSVSEVQEVWRKHNSCSKPPPNPHFQPKKGERVSLTAIHCWPGLSPMLKCPWL